MSKQTYKFWVNYKFRY